MSTLTELPPAQRVFTIILATAGVFALVCGLSALIAVPLHVLAGVAPLDAYAAGAFLTGSFYRTGKPGEDGFWPAWAVVSTQRAIILAAVIS